MKYYSVGYAGKKLARLSSVGQRIFSTVLCSQCGHIPHGGDPLHADVLADFDHSSRLGALEEASLGFIRRDFALQAGLSQYLALGSVSFENNPSSEWWTFRGKYPVYIRGNDASTFWICNRCRYSVYFPLGDNRYVLKAQVQPDRVYVSQLTTLVIPGPVFDPQVFSGEDFEIEELEVSSSVRDGHAEFNQ